MAQKMDNGDEAPDMTTPTGRLIVAETLRSTAQSLSSSKKDDEEKDGGHISLFWRVFGGTIISISSLIVITLYNNLSSGIADIRNDLNQERKAREDLVKKDEFNSRSTNIYDRIRTLDAIKPELEGLRERVTANCAAVDGIKKENGMMVDGLKKDVATSIEGMKKEIAMATDLLKKDEAQMDLVKERLTAVEGVKKDLAGIEILKDKLATAAAEMKTMQEELLKLQQVVDRTRTSDLERKSSQDLQFKQVLETMKDLQKGLQDCREKIAHLEGAQPTAARPASTKP